MGAVPEVFTKSAGLEPSHKVCDADCEEILTLELTVNWAVLLLTLPHKLLTLQ